MSGTAAPRPVTLPVWRLLGSELCAPRGCRDDPRLRSILDRAIADPQILQELTGWPIELSTVPSRHLVQSRPPRACVSGRFVAAANRAGATLDVVEPGATALEQGSCAWCIVRIREKLVRDFGLERYRP